MGLYDPGDAPDPTEQARRELIPRMPAELAAARSRGEPVWTADEMARDFEALGFMAPFVVVRRLADLVRGTLMFTGHPRYYFGWEPETPTPTPAPTPNAVSGLHIPRRPLFQLGQLVATPGAIEAMRRKGIDPLQLIARHVTGDWGDLDADDKRANDLAVQQGLRILSAYGSEHDPDRLWVITEADRSVTTLLLPAEY